MAETMFQGAYFKDSIIEEIKINACNERKVYLIEEFDRESIFKIIRRIDKIINTDIKKGISPKDAEPITIYIDSYGGCLLSCFGIISVMRSYQKQGWTINTVGMSRTMSAGFYLLLCGNRRSVYELCSLMVHDQRAFEYGYKTVRDKRVELQEWEKEWNKLISIVEEYSLITREQLEWYVERARDWNMDAQEALELGVIDEII